MRKSYRPIYFSLIGLIFLIISWFSVEGYQVLSSIPEVNAVILKDTCIRPYDGYSYRTGEILLAYIDGELVTVPKGFITDLASIPRWYWSIISPARSDLILGAIVHDYLYSCHHEMTRKNADAILYNLLIANGVDEYTAKKFYLAVRVFGSSHYGSERFCTSLK